MTSAGRRGYLVEYFKNALQGTGEVHVGNSAPLSPVFYYGDKSVVTPLIYDGDYLPFLKRYCREQEITAVIPLFDVDLFMLAKHREEFAEEGVTLIVSAPEVIDICNDKWKTFEFCRRAGLAAPKTYCKQVEAEAALAAGEIAYPVIIKPRWGMGSIAVYQADNREELEVLAKKVKREIFQSYLKYESAFEEEVSVLFQEKIKGQEYGLDVMHDLAGNHHLTVVRKKIAMRSGETDCAQVVEDAAVEAVGTAAGRALGHIGNLDMDVFVTEERIYVLELNARFGGGYPFSHLAGVDLPGAIVKWLNKEPLDRELVVKKPGIYAQKDIRIIDITDCIPGKMENGTVPSGSLYAV